MLDLPNLAISDRHARGLRRDIERRIRDRRLSYRLERCPRKFGPRVRMVHELLYSTLGPGRAMLLERNKKFAMWVCGELNADGLYQLRAEALRKRDNEVLDESYDFPLLATAHFYERLIQGLRYEGHTLITTLVDVVRLLIEEVGIDEAAAEERWPTWQRHGNAWFALEYGMVAGDIPRYGEVVLRTIMPLASLHSARFAEWEAMRAEGRLVSVSLPQASREASTNGKTADTTSRQTTARVWRSSSPAMSMR
ncbi:MAG: hypothetical protein ACKOCF_00135 [Gammaproteobacteria bacterium]|nr:hypothetical protein [Gammaproteobacteria bacterium]